MIQMEWKKGSPVHRHAGGLESPRLKYYQQHHVHRHAGGLEITEFS